MVVGLSGMALLASLWRDVKADSLTPAYLKARLLQSDYV